jgi:hypothetical protein
MLLLAVLAVVLPAGLTRRSAATSAVSQPNQPLSSATSRPELVHHPACTLPIGLGFIHGWRWGFNMPSEEAMELMEQHAEVAYALDHDTVNV